MVYSHTSRPDQAIAAYRKALKLSPNEKALLVNTGLLYLKQEAHARALPYFAKAVAIDPQHLQARQLLAVCRLYTGEIEPALHDLEALHAAAPRDEGIMFLLGFAYLKNRAPEKAKVVFGQMLDAAGPARAQLLLGKAYYEATMFPEAEESLQAALHLDPSLPGARIELAKVHISLRQTDEAIRELEALLKENPSDGDASYFLGGLLVQEGRFADGIPYLEVAKKMKPDSWAAYFYLGKAKLRLDQPKEAAVLLQRAVELNPDEASAFYHLGRALEALGRTEARRALVRVRE